VVAVLPKLHVNRNTARSIVFGPADLGGIGLPTVYSEQSFDQLAYFTGHINLADKTGKLLLVSLSYLQLISGSERSILQQSYKHYQKLVEPVWLTSLWAFLTKAKYQIIVKQEWLLTRPRYNDHCLMDHFMKLGFSHTQLGMFNRCRLNLQVIHLSDIASADGSIIIPDCKHGVRLIDQVSNLNWPIQDRPSNVAWRLWHQALAHFENHGRLLLPLQQWVGKTNQWWRWYTTPRSVKLFHSPRSRFI